jgi:hypothetical protein
LRLQACPAEEVRKILKEKISFTYESISEEEWTKFKD